MCAQVSICITCQGGTALADAVEQVIPVQRVDCMNVCTRPACVSIRETGKAAYLFGDVTPDLAECVPILADLYASAEGGIIEDARPLGVLRTRLIGRVPA